MQHKLGFSHEKLWNEREKQTILETWTQWWWRKLKLSWLLLIMWNSSSCVSLWLSTSCLCIFSLPPVCHLWMNPSVFKPVIFSCSLSVCLSCCMHLDFWTSARVIKACFCFLTCLLLPLNLGPHLFCRLQK